MRLVVAPDKFAGSLTAAEFGSAFATGWLARRPDDVLDIVPMADGGPGFLDCLAGALPGTSTTVTVDGPDGRPVPGRLFRSGDTCYLEAADAVGRHLLAHPDPLGATSAGLGQLVAAAVASGAARVVVGLGGSATTDGGAGMLGGLGATATRGDGSAVSLRHGGGGLVGIERLDLTAARQAVAGRELVAASDVDSPLLGPTGASRMFSAQKGATSAQTDALEESLTHWARIAGPDRAGRPGAGAAGGIGFGLLLLGAHRLPGVDVVLAALDVPGRCAIADLVVTGEGSLDEQSLHGKVVSGVVAAAGGRPAVVIAGRCSLAPAVWGGAGITRVETIESRAASTQDAMHHAAAHVTGIAGDLAHAWPE